MKPSFANDLQPNQQITSIFLVQNKDIRQKKGGDPYLSLLLCDKTGEVDAKMWDNVAEVMDTFDRDDFIKVKGQVLLHQNRLQVNIHKLQRVPEAEVNLAEYFPASDRNPEEMFTELRGLLAGMTNPHLKALLDLMLDDPEIARRYKLAPAAKSVHHAYLSGLLEHVLSMAHLARMLGGHYKGIDADLLMAGVVLHDIGKIYELHYERSFGYTTEGHLLGHIHMGVLMVGEKLRGLPDFPSKLRVLLEHLILSHHGQLEYGSPKVPLFPEALLLHHIDNLDSKMESMRVSLDRDRQFEGHLTAYNSALERSVLKKERYLNGAPAVPAKPAVVPPVSVAAPPAKPVPPAPPKENRPPQLGVLGERLKAALGKE
jgi:3'-5' exoribonuclease